MLLILRLATISLLLVGLLPHCAQAVAVDQEPLGYYVLTSAQSTTLLADTLLANPHLAGALLRRNWADINPSAGQYDWTWLDASIAQLRAAGKSAQITVFAGVNAPSWIYGLGAAPLTFTDARFPGQTFTMPVPWDPVMLAQWSTFVQALGARYDGDATVTAVHMAGPTEFSAEMYVPAAALQVPGASTTALTAAWTQVIGSYNTAFPNTAVVLDLSNPSSATDGVASAVAAVAVATLGSRATLQHDSLHATTSADYNIQALLVQYATQGVRVGFEMLSSSSETRFGGAFANAVAIGKLSGARYLNVYSPDVAALTAPYIPAVNQNPANPMDVDGNGAVIPLDALLIINYLNANGPVFLPPPVGANPPPPYLDVNGDGILSALDALLVINTLNAGL